MLSRGTSFVQCWKAQMPVSILLLLVLLGKLLAIRLWLWCSGLWKSCLITISNNWRCSATSDDFCDSIEKLKCSSVFNLWLSCVTCIHFLLMNFSWYSLFGLLTFLGNCVIISYFFCAFVHFFLTPIAYFAVLLHVNLLSRVYLQSAHPY